MTLKKAVEHIGKAIENLEEIEESGEAVEILDRIHHQLQDECRLVGRGARIDSSGHKYLGIRKCEYRDDS